MSRNDQKCSGDGWRDDGWRDDDWLDDDWLDDDWSKNVDEYGGDRGGAAAAVAGEECGASVGEADDEVELQRSDWASFTRRQRILLAARTAFKSINASEYLICNSGEGGAPFVNYHLSLDTGKTWEEILRVRQVKLTHFREENRFPQYSPACIAHSARQGIYEPEGVGQCYETAAIVFHEVLVDFYEDFHDLRLEIFNDPADDHNFVVINRRPGSDPAVPATWGADCLVADRWVDSLCFIDEYLQGKDPGSFDYYRNSEAVSHGPSKTARGISDELGYAVVCVPRFVVRRSINLSNFKSQKDVSAYWEKTTECLNSHVPFSLRALECDRDESDRNAPRMSEKECYRESAKRILKNCTPREIMALLRMERARSGDEVKLARKYLKKHTDVSRSEGTMVSLLADCELAIPLVDVRSSEKPVVAKALAAEFRALRHLHQSLQSPCQWVEQPGEVKLADDPKVAHQSKPLTASQ